MLFSSLIFLYFFLPIVLFIYFLIRPSFRNLFLLVASLVFYFWGEQVFFWVFLSTIVFNYFISRAILASNVKSRKKLFLIFGICLNALTLIIFKYLNFITFNLNNFFSNIAITDLALPIGISFFIFQEISYLVDIYKAPPKSGKVSFINTALYISLFPQLIAGPIVKYSDIDEQLENRSLNYDKFQEGTIRFIQGLGKKILIADSLGKFVDLAFSSEISSLGAVSWFIITLYAFQIYYDFSGYSDMAIGLGKMFGFEFLENFNFPYISRSISEFWRRWNISLGSCFENTFIFP